MGTLHVVGISQCKTSSDPSDSVVTYALGSCVGLALHDRHAGVGGMAHILLPDSRWRSPNRSFNPHSYADSAVPALLAALVALGATRRRLVAKLAGGATMLTRSISLDIGSQNAQVLLHVLAREGIAVHGTSLGGTVGRSMQLRIQDGLVLVQASSGRIETL